MSLIIAYEWCRHFEEQKAKGTGRDYEADTDEAEALAEEIYE